VIVDDVLASGGSALAAIRLVSGSQPTRIRLAVVADVALLREMPQRIEIENRGVAVIALASL
jgi:adenine/guanine phosphoribosyltransferase-like PRPP-binding protein